MIDKYLDYLLHIRKYSPNTIKTYKEALTIYQTFLNNHHYDILNITDEIVKEYQIYITNIYHEKTTMASRITAIRAFYTYLYKDKKIKNNPFSNARNPKLDKKLPKFLQFKELEQMFSIPNLNTPLGIRNRLILEMLYATGVRVYELVSIKLNDINSSNHTIKILGKGSKERIVIYGEECATILDKYIKEGRPKLLKQNNSYLFLNNHGQKITDRSIRNILNNIILQSSLNLHITPHTLRHSFATAMLNKGADLITVKELLGHESLNTTSIYTHVTNEQLRKVYEFAHPRAKEK